ncbi:MAG: FAD-dependent oxidoreductase [Desulfovibrio sp.]|nr:FAD-dependent oxidoreductase [Desulfovibrio sp.]
MKTPQACRILICGAGIIGITLARELISRGLEDITLIEAEAALGAHSSGRNSGVLHSGIYYAPESVRAKTCLEGNRLLRAWCEEKGLPLAVTGKVIVARREEELISMENLRRRAESNGATVRVVDEKELREIEPLARTVGNMALYSPETAVLDPKATLESLTQDCLAGKKARLLYNTRFTGLKDPRVAKTTGGDIAFSYFINTAGPFSDVVAHAFGLGRHYALIPFKGIYQEFASPHAAQVRGNIYPVPDPRNPFLGVHFTRSISGRVYVGPTAIPAFSRLNYKIISDICLREVPSVIHAVFMMFTRNPGFRAIALSEPRKYFSRFFHADAQELVRQLAPQEILPCSKVGLRHQLVDTRDWTMVMDFLAERDERSFHVLNAISPGFTSSMALAKHMAETILPHL